MARRQGSGYPLTQGCMSDSNYDKINNHPMLLDYSGHALMVHYDNSCFPTMHREAAYFTSPRIRLVSQSPRREPWMRAPGATRRMTVTGK